MMVTDEQVAMLRAYLVGDDAELDRLSKMPDQPGFNALVATTFVAAVKRRFGADLSTADLVRLVANVRAHHLEDPDLLDPLGAERLIRVALGDQQLAAQLDNETKARGQVLLLPVLVDAEDLDDADLDQLLADARRAADNLPLS
jgi:hypothetical protein